MVRFLLLITSVLVVVFLLLKALRFYGLQRSYSEKEHVFLQDTLAVVAHRGGSLEAPENTLESFQKALEISPHIILELDIRITKDDVFVVIHDDSVDRTTDGKGRVRDLTLKEIKALNAGYHFTSKEGIFPYRENPIQVPTLKEVVQAVPKNRLIIEIKDNLPDIHKKAAYLFEELNITKRALFGSEFSVVISSLRELRPEWTYAATKNEISRFLMLASLKIETIDSMPADVFLIPMESEGIRVFSERLLNEAQRRKKPVMIWTINNREEMQKLIRKGVQGIITDKPTTLQGIISQL